MSSCETVTRCFSGSTTITLPLKSYLFALLRLHATKERQLIATKRHISRKIRRKAFVLFVPFRGLIIFVAGVGRCRGVDKSSNSPSLCRRNPSSARNRSRERIDRRHSRASVRSSVRGCQRRRCRNRPQL